LWTHDVEFEPQPRRRARRRGPNALQRRKQAEVDELAELGVARVGALTEHAFLAAGAALYAGEGSKTDGAVKFANTDARLMRFFCRWLRHFFVIDESRLRGTIYLHQGLDYDAALAHWSAVMDIPEHQFTKPYRAIADPTMRWSRHEFGCAYFGYGCSRTHRAVMGLVNALVSCNGLPG
jgi:hypothetical protein